FSGVATVLTVHNLGYQGIHDAWVLGLAGLGLEQFYPGGPFEFWGRVNFLKVGLAFADTLTTVSPRYAREIQENGEFGLGLEGVLRRRIGSKAAPISSSCRRDTSRAGSIRCTACATAPFRWCVPPADWPTPSRNSIRSLGAATDSGSTSSKRWTCCRRCAAPWRSIA